MSFFIKAVDNYTRARIEITLETGEKWEDEMKAPYPRFHEFWDRSSDSVQRQVTEWAKDLGADSVFLNAIKN